MTGPAAAAGTTILAIDSATTRVVVAVGTLTGELIDATDWPAGYRHGETLLPTIDDLLERLEVAPAPRWLRSSSGTGPGAFTGLRVGIATAKGMAHALGVPIVGVSTADALLAGAGPEPCCCFPPDPPIASWSSPAGPPASSRPARTPGVPDGATLVALDLADRAPADALERGEAARARLGASLLALGAARLASGQVDDLAALVPEYVTLPRGVSTESGEVSWSRDPR